MLYVQQTLTPGEELVYIGHFHWIYTLGAVLSIVWGILGCAVVICGGVYFKIHYGGGFASPGLMGAIRELHPAVRLIALLSVVMGLLRFAVMMIIRATTEIAVTTSRVVYKRGLVARYVGEMSIDRIEGVNVLQTVMGRMLNYGRLMVLGLGVGEVIFPTLADPITFRKAIERARTA